jgi:hypothetical protein
MQWARRLSAELGDLRNYGAAAVGRILVAGIEPQRRLLIRQRHLP